MSWSLFENWYNVLSVPGDKVQLPFTTDIWCISILPNFGKILLLIHYNICLLVVGMQISQKRVLKCFGVVSEILHFCEYDTQICHPTMMICSRERFYENPGYHKMNQELRTMSGFKYMFASHFHRLRPEIHDVTFTEYICLFYYNHTFIWIFIWHKVMPE